jgi:hypothetical protein
MEIMLVWERAARIQFNRPPPVPACLILHRVATGVYRLVLPPLPPSSLIVGVLWVPTDEFIYLAATYMDDYVERRLAPS